MAAERLVTVASADEIPPGGLKHVEVDGEEIQYDVRTGLNEFDHAIRLRTYEVRIEDGEVKVAL